MVERLQQSDDLQRVSQVTARGACWFHVGSFGNFYKPGVRTVTRVYTTSDRCTIPTDEHARVNDIRGAHMSFVYVYSSASKMS